MLVQEPVQAAVWDSLNHYQLDNAIFLAERLFAEVPNNETQFLLGTCYYRAGKPFQTYTFMQKRSCDDSPECKFLLAKCCVDVEKYLEAEMLLAGNILSKEKSQEEIEAEFGSLSSQVFALLGDMYSKTHRTEKAIENYKKSLQLNPLMWCSYQKICQLGGKVDPAVCFKVPKSLVVPQSLPVNKVDMASVPVITVQSEPAPVTAETPPVQHHQHQIPVITESPAQELDIPHEQVSTTPNTNILGSAFHTPENTENIRDDILNTVTAAPKSTRKHLTGMSVLSGTSLFPCTLQFTGTPSFGLLPIDTPPAVDVKPGKPLVTPSPIALADTQIVETRAPRKAVTRRQQNQSQTLMPKPPGFNPSGNTNTRDSNTNVNMQCNPPRRSSRLFGNSNSSSVKENNKAKSNYPSPKAPGRKSKTRLSKKQELNEINKGEVITDSKPPPNPDTTAQISLAQMQHQSLVGVLSLLQCVGKAYQSLCRYQCQVAVELFEELPPHQLSTGWVLCQMGRAYYELQEHQKAERCFLEVRRLEPYRILDMEVYSTSLWHLQKDVELSHLAQQLQDMDQFSPQAQCTIGNCFSLQKEHDTAIKFFKRAIQIDPSFSYAYTLLGHEYVFTEELDDAMQCFRSAVHADQRNYKAWYGIGQIYYKQEKFQLAEVHFRRALMIHPHSSALLCHIAVVQHAQKKSDAALVTLNKAISADTRNPLCKFHRASILHACDKHEEALTELEDLKQIVPKESLIYFLMGKIHKKLGNTHLALTNFSWAMDLDPKGINNQIKEAIDKRYAIDEEDSLVRLEEDTGADEVSGSSLMDPDDILQAVESDESL